MSAGRAVMCVGNQHHAVWDEGGRERNDEFLKSIDHTYFEYLAATHARGLKSKQRQQAAVALRVTYGHALETFFALAAAAVQAPHCVYGWLDRYRAEDLRLVLNALDGGAEVPHVVRGPLSWDALSVLVHRNLILDSPARTDRLRSAFARFWRRAAAEFTDQAHGFAYNAAKHGLRLRAGGFRLAMGPVHKPGEPTRPERMHSLGGSEFGATILRLERLEPHKRDYRVVMDSQNWAPGRFVSRTRLLAMSINNVVSCLRIASGANPEAMRFFWPQRLRLFHTAWAPLLGVHTMRWPAAVSPNDIQPTTRDHVLAAYARARSKSRATPGGPTK